MPDMNRISRRKRRVSLEAIKLTETLTQYVKPYLLPSRIMFILKLAMSECHTLAKILGPVISGRDTSMLDNLIGLNKSQFFSPHSPINVPPVLFFGISRHVALRDF